jgi:cytidine kinase
MKVAIVGTVALDSVLTPEASREDQLGGSASYAAFAATYFAPTEIISIVGKDFPNAYFDYFTDKHIGISSIDISPGATFRWSGEYFADMNNRETRSVAVNVLEEFAPILFPTAKSAEIVLLANCAPDNQLQALDQVTQPRFVISDSMDLWVEIAQPRLLEVLQRTDLFVINDSEAKLFMGTKNAVVAGWRLLNRGPKFVIVKKGEHGAMLFGPDGLFFSVGAYPLTDVVDPTGAGDAFVGGIAGYLAQHAGETITFADIKKAMLYGTALASFNCESFSVDRLRMLAWPDIEERVKRLTEFVAI